jgi:hypothetical protein
MHVENAVVPRRYDGTEIEKYDLSLKLADAVHRSLRRAEHKAGEDVFLFDSSDTNPNLLASLSGFDFVFGLSVKCGNCDFLPVRHHLIPQ